MKPRILITVGDVNGIGPEVVIRSLTRKNLLTEYEITVITPPNVLEYYSKLLNINLKGPFDIIFLEEMVKIEPGKLSEHSGHAAGIAIENAIKLCMDHEYNAMVTAPISKKALNLGGYHYDGHTEMLTVLSKSKDAVMFMYSKKINIAFASTHPPLSLVPKMITKELLLSKLSICVESLKKDFKIKKPKIGILSFNPHAGDEGQIGMEEIDIIKPAITAISKKYPDLKIDGPFPSDAYFGNKKFVNYDLTFALYHDQGFIPFKMIAGYKGVNCTVGLPFVRTSPDHGTAFDIAAKNLADETSMIESIMTAGMIYKNRKL